MDFGLQDRHAVIIGSTAGLGNAIALALRAEGADVTLTGRDAARLEAAVSAARKAPGQGAVHGQILDMLDEARLRSAVEAISRSSPIDILVNNTGGPVAGSALSIALTDWDKGYASLLRHVVLLAQLVVPGMRARGWGRVLTITSTSARELIPRLPVSSTFRAGLSAWTKELAREVGRAGVLVNNLLPGPTNTPRLKELETKSPEFYASMAEKTAVGRIAEPEEIGRVAAFLCSNSNTFITGTDVLVDGGYTSAL